MELRQGLGRLQGLPFWRVSAVYFVYFVLCMAFVFGVGQDLVSPLMEGGERRRVNLSCKSLFSVKPFAGAALQPLICSLSLLQTFLYFLPLQSVEKNLPCCILLLTSVFPQLLPLHFLPTPPVHPNLGRWLLPSQLVFAGDCRVNGEIKFHCCF